MLKMADACQEANKHKQTTFQEMYVQRHNNVRYENFFIQECNGMNFQVTSVLL